MERARKAIFLLQAGEKSLMRYSATLETLRGKKKEKKNVTKRAPLVKIALFLIDRRLRALTRYCANLRAFVEKVRVSIPQIIRARIACLRSSNILSAGKNAKDTSVRGARTTDSSFSIRKRRRLPVGVPFLFSRAREFYIRSFEYNEARGKKNKKRKKTKIIYE